jgi:glycosyltransferase involved in cell wall biosynthesis
MSSFTSSFVSVVAIVSDGTDRVGDFVARATAALGELTTEYELILVDDAAGPAAAAACDRAIGEYECVRVIRLSRRFGADVAATAGLDSAIGDLTVVMDAATDPPERIADFVALGEDGADLVIGTTGRHGRPWLRTLAWAAYHGVFRAATGLQLVDGAGTMRLFNRRAVNALTRMRQKSVHLRLLDRAVGFNVRTIDYRPVGPWRRRSWAASAAEGISMLVAHSPAPLRMVSYLGGCASLLNVACMAWVVAVNLWKDRVVEGWTTLSLQLAIMFFFLFTTLILVAEYLAHAFEEVKDRPLYHVADELAGSTVLSDARKRNIRLQSPFEVNDDDDDLFLRHRA